LKTTVFVLALALLGYSSQSSGEEFEILNPGKTVKQGQVLIVKVDPNFTTPGRGLNFMGKTYQSNKNGYIYIGIDAGEKNVGSNIMYMVENGFWVSGSQATQVEIVDGGLPVEKINRKAAATLVDSKIRAREADIIARAYAKGDKFEDFTDGNFVNPLDSIFITDPFGFREYSNAKLLHRGVDLRAPGGTNVLAINSGRVVLARTKFSLEGSFVIIDHGSDVFSVYMHLSRIKVKEGQTVKKGEIIGLSGSTGNSTGPHLHLAVKVSGTVVDPLSFIEMINLYKK